MHMLNMVDNYPGGWRPPIIMAKELEHQEEFEKTIESLVDTMGEHYQNIVKNDLLGERIERKVMLELNEALESTILEPIILKLMEKGKLDDFLDKVVKKESLMTWRSGSCRNLRNSSTILKYSPWRRGQEVIVHP